MSKFKTEEETALCAPWSCEDYDRWLREQEARDEAVRDIVNVRIVARFDPECEAAVRALEELNWGCQEHSRRNR